jgi:hypothetical protein
MCLARQRAEWLRVGIGVAFVVNRNGWTQQAISPLAVIPEAFRPEPEPVPELTTEERAEQSRIGWRLLDRAFGGFPPREAFSVNG